MVDGWIHSQVRRFDLGSDDWSEFCCIHSDSVILP